MKIALFRATGKYHFELVFTMPDGDTETPREGCIRVSEWMEPQFVMLAREDIVGTELAALDKERAEITADFARRLKDIDDRKATLLAITAQAETA